MKTKAPFGTWQSPISAELVAGQSLSFRDLVVDGDTFYWSEMRPDEKGRTVIVSYNDGQKKDVLPEPYSARSRVHEYGGNAFAVSNNQIYFINDKDQQLYHFQLGQRPRVVTKAGMRFGDLRIIKTGILAVCEQALTTHEVKNFLVLINPENGAITTLHEGFDFYAQIAVSQDEQQIAWISWQLPNMPWDNNELWTARLANNQLTNLKRIDAQTKEQSFFQPQWRNDNALFCVTDKSNWWNLYKVIDDNTTTPVFEVESELGLPLWVFNMSTWCFFQGGIACLFSDNGINKLWHFQKNQLKSIPLPYAEVSQLTTNGKLLYMVAGSANSPNEIIQVDANFQYSTIAKTATLDIDKSYLSCPEHITFDTTDNRKAHAYFYPPTNKQFEGMDNTLPPLIVKSHGGPTASAGISLNMQIQYWTSRGFAFVDVNYAGSTGYGRSYRHSLNGKWGIYDVDDCIHAAKYLINHNYVDEHKIAITGGSAGGFTTLAALTFTDFFKVGASLYGVSDLEALAQDTHKFEAKYLDTLIAPYPEGKAMYYDRSPIHHVDQLSAPVIFFQGGEDKVVPPSQAEKMVQALQEKGIHTKYILYEHEQHGFRDKTAIVTTLSEQLNFFCEVLDLT